MKHTSRVRQIEQQRAVVSRLRGHLVEGAGTGVVEAYDSARDLLLDMLERERTVT